MKFVLVDRADYDWAKSIIARHRLTERCRAVLLSPVVEHPAGEEIPGVPDLSWRELAEWILRDGLPVRLQIQLHKLIWDPQTRGV